MVLLLALAGIFAALCLGICVYAMARPDQFFADAPAVRLAQRLNAAIRSSGASQ